MTQSILVAGGAGYIGSHMVKALSRLGYAVTVFDNLSTGHRDAARFGKFVEGDLRDGAALDKLFRGTAFDAVMHFAGCCYVGESVSDPAKYYANNVLGTFGLLEAMRRHGANKLVFSSSCTVYGVPERLPIAEDGRLQPISPYGVSKYLSERMMADYAGAYGLRAIALRYFNAAGCDPDGELGEQHDPEPHLIPLVLREALRVRRGEDASATSLGIYGDTYPTPDGTCIRDYVHVADLCGAHLLAMQRLLEGKVAGFEPFNLGTGLGLSVKEIIEAARRITGVSIQYRILPPRPGDPPQLVASPARAQAILGWTPVHKGIDAIIGTAWRWLDRT